MNGSTFFAKAEHIGFSRTRVNFHFEDTVYDASNSAMDLLASVKEPISIYHVYAKYFDTFTFTFTPYHTWPKC